MISNKIKDNNVDQKINIEWINALNVDGWAKVRSVFFAQINMISNKINENIVQNNLTATCFWIINNKTRVY